MNGKLFQYNISVFLLLITGVFLIPDCFVSRHVTTGVLGITMITMLYALGITRDKTIRISLFIVFAFGFTVFWASHQVLGDVLATQDRIAYLSLCLLLYVFSRNDFDKNRLRSYYFIGSLAGVCMSSWGILQYLGIVKNYYQPVAVTGSFENPAGIAMFLGALFPCALFFAGERDKWSKIWGFLACVFMAVILILSRSMTGILTISIVGALYCYKETRISWRRPVSRKWLFLLAGLLGVIFLIALYYWKKDSADGRMLIWMCSWDMFLDHWLVGAGSGAFQAEYMQYQAAYFREHPASLFNMLADNVRHPFNEYLKILTEYGLVGFGILLIFVYYLVKVCWRNWDDHFLFPIFCSLLAIGMSACFSYPLSYPGIGLILGLNLAIVSSCCFKGWEFRKKSGVLLFKGVLLAGVLCLSWMTFHWIEAERKWHDATTLLAGKMGEVLPCYRTIYPWMKHDGLFLYNYGAELYRGQKYWESLAILKECCVYFNDVDVQLLLAENYFHLKQYKESEEHLLLASAMCPVRFISLYKLFHVYMETGDTTRAFIVGCEILNKPVKIMSSTVKYIKVDIKRELDKY